MITIKSARSSVAQTRIVRACLAAVLMSAVFVQCAHAVKRVHFAPFRPLPPHAQSQGAPVVAGKNPAKSAAMKPNIDLYIYRRCYTPSEKVELSLSAFNVRRVQFAAYPLDLAGLVKSSKDMQHFRKAIDRIDLGKSVPVAQWQYKIPKAYPDQWNQSAAPAPHLRPGTYVVAARIAGAEVRTWVAVTQVALVTKRSRQELLVFAVDAASGKPIPGVSLALTDEHGPAGSARTGADGTLRIPTVHLTGTLWLDGNTAFGPAFALAGEPAAPQPFTVYTVTDRPIYRPGNLVQYKASIRQRVEGDAPGGFAYKPYAGPVSVEIRDATDAVIERKTLTTNAFGSIDSSFQLAPEPTLGDWHLNLAIGDNHYYADFAVQSYRKPEMTFTASFDKPHYLGGGTIPLNMHAEYYFGRPVADASVKYRVTYNGDRAEPDYEGKGATDSSGNLHLDIPTQRLPNDRDLSVSATLTDLSRRTIQAQASTTIAAALFQLSLDTDQQEYLPGKRVAVHVTATDYDDKPVAAVKVRVTMTESKTDRLGRDYNETTTQEVTTNAHGEAVAEFSSPRPGSLQFDAEAFDSERDKATAETTVEITDNRKEVAAQAAPPPPPLSLVAPDKSFRPGQAATFTIDCPLVGTPAVRATKDEPAKPAHPDAWALVTVEGERLGECRVLHLTSRHTKFPITVSDRDFPSVQIDVAVIQDRQIYEQQARCDIERGDQRLTVRIAPDRPAGYQPGDQATYTVTTLDNHGKPVSADVSLGVVDKSIYDVAPDSSQDMESVFYGGQEVRIETAFSFAAQYSGGGYQTIARAAAGLPAPPGIRVRNNFVDTAYWKADVITGADGAGTISFTVPDNLTTWRATAHGMTLATSVGSATNDVVSSMPLLARLELPRFVVAGDQAVFSAIIQNGTNSARSVKVHVESKGATLSDSGDRTIQLAASGQQRLDWKANVTGPGEASVLVSADGGAGAQDAVQQSIPVLDDSVKVVAASAETQSEDEAKTQIDIASLPPGASVILTLSPSIASSLFSALHELTSATGDSGDDSEDTVSVMLPDIVASQALNKLSDVGSRRAGDLAKRVSLDLQRLYRYQHPDGGWNWWEFDQTDGDMTAYILGALIQARDAGFTVDDQRIRRGAHALEDLLPGQEELGRRADWLLVLSQVDPKFVGKPMDELYAQRDKLDTYDLASLALALAKLSDAGHTSKAQTVAGELECKAVAEGRTVSWAAPPGRFLWCDDDVTITAHVLRALMTVSPNSADITPAVRWLMANRTGDGWETARAGAEAVLALTQYMQITHELQPSYTASVSLDGQTQKTLTPSAATVSNPPLEITLTADQLKGHQSITIDKQGVGVLYVSEVVTSAIPSNSAPVLSRGIAVQRLFQIAVEDPSKAQTIASGTEVDVQLSIIADADYRYVKLTDPLPAGCQVDTGDDTDQGFPIDFSDGDVGYTRQEVRDDRVEFYFDQLPKGKTRLTYRLIAEQPGVYRILPSVTELHYFPEVRGNTAAASVVVGEAAP